MIFKIAVLFSAVLLFSCSQVKFVPDDKYLVSKVNVEINNPKLEKDIARSYIKQKENYKIIGFLKFHLFMYNLSSKNRSEGWLKRIGEPPQIYDEMLSQRSEEQLKQYAYSKGYFRTKVESEFKFNDNKKKVELTYKLYTGDQYKIRQINYLIPDSTLYQLYFKSELKQELNPGDPFDLEMLEMHRSEIVTLFRDNGYYYFSNDNIKFPADTSSYSKQVILNLFVSSAGRTEVDSAKVFQPFFLNNFYYSVLPGNTALISTLDSVKSFSDTLRWDKSILYESNVVTYPPTLLDRTIQMKSGDLFNSSSVKNSFLAFNRLRQFRFVDIQFQETTARNDSNLLDTHIRLAPLNKQSTSFDIEGTNTSGNFGVAGNLAYQHRNLFKGAEVFEIKLRGAVERLHNKGVTDYFNTREFGIESSIMIPKLLGPGNYIHNFERFLPKTVVSLGYNYQKRPEYTRTISNLKFGYDWKSTEYLRNIWNLVDYNKVQVFEYDPTFLDRIQDLYIKSSFSDHLILAMNYSLIYNNQNVNAPKKYTYTRLNIESAGNLLSVLANLTKSKKVELSDTLGYLPDKYYEVLNTRFAQYVKADVEFRYSYKIDDYNSVVFRAFLGVGLPYGNFDVLPFEKQYFTGGANGIRAWPVRSLGPGTYSFKESPEYYPNQTSDIKLEANAEYRFKLTGFLEGALFIDAGNIWAITGKDNREGALFYLNSFYKQIAIGTGTGVRFDFNYFIFRLDLGAKLREPSQSENNGWIVGHRSYTNKDFNLNFAIGYPF